MVCAPVRRDNLRSGIIDHTSAQTMFYLTCTTITCVDLAHYGVSHPKDWVSVDVLFPVKIGYIMYLEQTEMR